MRILHISDLHVETPPERIMPGVMSWLADDQRELAQHRADFAIVTGDLASVGGAELDDMKLAKEWLDGLGLPYLALPGNHDMAKAGSGSEEPDPDAPLADTHFGQVFGGDAIRVHQLGDVRIVGLVLRERDPDGVVDHLEEVLRADPGPVILCGHYPLQTVRDSDVLAEFGAEGFAGATAAAVRAIVGRNANVVLYACGHIHASSALALTDHCTQISAGSLGQGSASYHVYDIDGDGLTSRTILGHGPLTFWDRIYPDRTYDVDYHFGARDERTVRISW
jgi:3',5'-cyclic AMP phosphodiesterase CpdA